MDNMDSVRSRRTRDRHGPEAEVARRSAGCSPKGRNERGAALLEAAIVTPLFLALLFGVVEGGFALHERLSVSNMALTGARSASGNGGDVLADFHLLQAVEKGAGGIAHDRIRTVVVYRAAGPSDNVPEGCKVASVPGVCNRYTGTDLVKNSTDFGCTGPPGPVTKVDSSWCPSARKIALTGSNGPPDHVGVYVEAVHQSLTGILGSSLTLRGDTVMRIEPRTVT
jgi:hypothetical protein